jgi:hypothetical protein
MLSLDSGSKPVVGSSKNKTFGSAIKALANSTLRL